MRPILLSSLVAVVCAGCAAPILRSTASGPPTPVQSAELWEAPNDLAQRNLFDGPWGNDLAPDPAAVYAFVTQKSVGGVLQQRWQIHDGTTVTEVVPA